MPARAYTVEARLLARRCLKCGYDGALLRGGQAHRCVRCGCDLRERPPRSYAEMEGLLGCQLSFDAPPLFPRREQNLVHRWLTFLFLALAAIVGIFYLSVAAFMM